jgi:hypothetical protein
MIPRTSASAMENVRPRTRAEAFSTRGAGIRSGGAVITVEVSWSVDTDKSERAISERLFMSIEAVCMLGKPGPSVVSHEVTSNRSITVQICEGFSPAQTLVSVGVLANLVYDAGGRDMRIRLLNE